MGMLAASLKGYNKDHEAIRGYVNMLRAWTAASNKRVKDTLLKPSTVGALEISSRARPQASTKCGK